MVAKEPNVEITGFHKGPMGFQIDFENGWTVSIQFGIGNYCDNRYNKGNPFTDIPDFLDSTTAEIAAWPTNSRGWSKDTSTKEWYVFEHGDQVDGYKKPDTVLEFMNMVSKFGVKELPNNWDNLPGAYDPVEPQEYGGEYISECCDATPIGELDSGSPLGGTEYYRVGFCSKCKDNAVFIKEEFA